MDNSSTNTIITIPKYHKNTKHGADIIISPKRIEENERHRFSLRGGK